MDTVACTQIVFLSVPQGYPFGRHVPSTQNIHCDPRKNSALTNFAPSANLAIIMQHLATRLKGDVHLLQHSLSRTFASFSKSSTPPVKKFISYSGRYFEFFCCFAVSTRVREYTNFKYIAANLPVTVVVKLSANPK